MVTNQSNSKSQRSKKLRPLSFQNPQYSLQKFRRTIVNQSTSLSHQPCDHCCRGQQKNYFDDTGSEYFCRDEHGNFRQHSKNDRQTNSESSRSTSSKRLFSPVGSPILWIRADQTALNFTPPVSRGNISKIGCPVSLEIWPIKYRYTALQSRFKFQNICPLQTQKRINDTSLSHKIFKRRKISNRFSNLASNTQGGQAAIESIVFLCMAVSLTWFFLEKYSQVSREWHQEVAQPWFEN